MISAVTGGMACSQDDCGQYNVILEQAHRYDGSSFSLGSPIFYGGPYNGQLFSYDGSYIKALANGDFIFPNGSALHYSLSGTYGNWNWTQTLEDANGNEISCTTGATNECVDTVGRVIAETNTTTSTGRQQTISYADSNGNTQSITLQYTNFALEYPWTDGNAVCGQDQVFNCIWNGGGGQALLTSIQMPNGASYTFQYLDNGDGTTTGELTKMTLPTGGYIRYTYTNEASPGYLSSEASNRVVSNRYISPNGTGGSEQPWTYNISGGTVASVTDPQGNVHTETFSFWTSGPDAWNGGGFVPLQPVPLSVQAKDTGSAGSLLKQVDKQWGYDSNPAYNFSPFWVPYSYNPELSQEATTLGGSALKAIKIYTYSNYGNVSEEDDYDWSSGNVGHCPHCVAPIRTKTLTYLADDNPAYAADTIHILNRKDSESISGNCGATSDLCATTTYVYDGYASGRLAAGLGLTVSVTQHDYLNFSSSNTLRGNVTQTISGPGLNGGTTTTDIAYNDLGDVVATMDGNTNVTAYDYTDHYSGPQPLGSTLAFVTKTTKPPTNGVQHIERRQYYLNSGLIAAHCGENFPAGSSCATGLAAPQSDYDWLTYDGMNRASAEHFGDGGSTTLAYNDVPFATSITQTKAIDSSQNMVTTALYDGLGRQKQSEVTDPEGMDYVDTTYDTLGRVQSVSNPYRSPSAAGDPPSGTTYYAYDALGRKTIETKPDGSAVQWCYQGIIATAQTNCASNASSIVGAWVDSSDEAGRHHQYITNGLGELAAIMESDPNTGVLAYETDYGYDATGDLTSVHQNGSSTDTPRVRTFSYDSLSRLLAATNPENGTITYSYDGNGNVQTKTDARGAITHFGYDGLNRLLTKSYTGANSNATNIANATPGVQYSYDQTSYQGIAISNGIGRRTGMNDASGASAWSYDMNGRLSLLGRNGWPAISYIYNWAGLVTSDGSSQGLTVSYDGVGRPTSLSNPQSSWVLVDGAQYTPSGLLKSVNRQLGGGWATTTKTFNNRLQLSSVGVSYEPSLGGTATTEMMLSYSYPAAPNNDGNVSSITDGLHPARSQQFTYDALNRLSGAWSCNSTPSSSTCSHTGTLWGNTYGYDSFGNLGQMNAITGSMYGQNLSLGNALPNNQFPQFAYDSAGNITYDGVHTFTYDAEGRLSSVDTVSYVYDGDGQRAVVHPANGNIDEYYLRDASGRIVEDVNETSDGVYNYFFGDELVYRAAYTYGFDWYPFYDALGSVRLVLGGGGQLVTDQDLYPFGGVIPGAVGSGSPGSGTPSQPYVFTGKERDAESGNDYFGARYYASSMGRFMSPDWSAKATPVPYAKLGDPQSLNLYAYVRNNPLSRIDPDGHDLWMKGCGKDSGTCNHDYVGSWDKGHKNFTPTTIQSDKNGSFSGHNVSMDKGGIHVDGKFQGVFASGTAATVVNGAGSLDGFRGTFSGNCAGHCEATGTLSALSGHSIDALVKTMRGPNESLDRYSDHDGSQYRGGNTDGPDIHISYVPGRSDQEAHFDWRFPFGSVGGFIQHTDDYIETKYFPRADPSYDKVGP